MSSADARNEVARSEKVLPGVWRLRLPCPWPGVPHVNAWALDRGDGVVLVDTGVAGEDGLHQLELALGQAKLKLTDVRLLVCTHAHTDHYGLAGPIVDAAGCELWMHPAWGHIRTLAEDPDKALERRIEVARQSGVPAAALERYESSRKDEEPLVARVVAPDRELVEGVSVATDLGFFNVYETPGHAPSHVVLHEPESGVLISGDHLLGRVSLFFDYGHTPDPVGEFLDSLDTVDELDVRLCLSGHGRPFRDVGAKIEANRKLVAEQLDRVRASLAKGDRTAFEVVPDLLGEERPSGPAAAWGLQLALAYLDHLAVLGQAERVKGTDPVAWRAI
ncbi:MAG: MBL fold metallo-hydrolase [Solirubrobacterales bacterium]|nr:MBL fold metallo-hydrolase [Solirubrobacterales bacterium]MCB8971085.1 MBL fold metallo-hydrolase [Thermoleophilales bacterium]MCO5328409.1 MBL fold metallo-hydrolase [Solirubrobacterales bacterium]